ncbi:MAG: hypothetical protein Kow0092_39780 [Deferrisomatales bacterium]
MTGRQPARWKSAALVLAALLATACGGGGGGEGPFPGTVDNTPGRFRVELLGVSGASRSDGFAWSNAAGRAAVAQSIQLDAGSALLTVYDAADLPVYQTDFSSEGTFLTDPGTAGPWRVELDLDGFGGTLIFELVPSP